LRLRADATQRNHLDKGLNARHLMPVGASYSVPTEHVRVTNLGPPCHLSRTETDPNRDPSLSGSRSSWTSSVPGTPARRPTGSLLPKSAPRSPKRPSRSGLNARGFLRISPG